MIKNFTGAFRHFGHRVVAKAGGQRFIPETARTRIARLTNGIPVVTRLLPYEGVVNIEALVLAGSRDEVASQFPRGTAHFLEHCFFQGSSRLGPRQGMHTIEQTGGVLNASTGIDFMRFKLSVRPKHTLIALDILADMLCRPSLTSSGVEAERPVVRLEWLTNKLDFYGSRWDRVLETAYNRHPIIHNPRGNEEAILKLTQTDIRNFYHQNFNTGRIAIAIEGNVKHQQIMDVLEEHIDMGWGNRKIHEFLPYSGGDQRCHKTSHGVNIALSFDGPKTREFCEDGRGGTYQVMAPYLEAKLSRLLRFDRSLVYGIRAGGETWLDGGLFGVAFDTFASKGSECLKIIRDELHDLTERVDLRVFETCQYAHKLACMNLQAFSPIGVEILARNLFLDKTTHPVNRAYRLRQAVTPEDLMRAARDLLSKPPTFVASGDISSLPSPDNIRNWFWRKNDGPKPAAG